MTAKEALKEMRAWLASEDRLPCALNSSLMCIADALETALAEKDAQIVADFETVAQMEANLKEKDRKIAELERAIIVVNSEVGRLQQMTHSYSQLVQVLVAP